MSLTITQITFNPSRNVTMTAYLTDRNDAPIGHISLPAKRPAIIICPGGGYRILADREALPAALPFISEGYQAFVLEYSIGDHAAWPLPLIDLSRAVRYVRLHAEELNVDPEQIAIMGFSAGGHLCAMLATLWNNDAWKDAEAAEYAELAPTLDSHADLLSVSNQPNAAILAYAVTRIGDLHPEAETTPLLNPVDQITPSTCPCFLWHTAVDATVPMEHATTFAQRLHDAGVETELHVFARGPHGISVGNRLTDYGIEDQVPANVTCWVPMALGWLNQLFAY